MQNLFSFGGFLAEASVIFAPECEDKRRLGIKGRTSLFLFCSRHHYYRSRKNKIKMNKAGLFKKYLWILSELMNAPQGRNYEELMDAWCMSSLNDTGNAISKRTLYDQICMVEEMFDVDIECNKRDHDRYLLKNMKGLRNDDVKSWLLSTFSVSNAIDDCSNLYERIAYERIPSGNEYLLTITGAMKENKKVKVTYQSFRNVEPRECLLAPYYLKVFKQRWYLVAVPEGGEKLYSYSLDRMKDVQLSDESFVYPGKMSVDEYFNDCYGIIFNPEDAGVEHIRLKVTDKNNKRQYLRTLPLHHSQKEIEKHGDYSIFEVTVYPTYDFIHELLSHGNELEVLEPQWVRKECKTYIDEMHALYSDLESGPQGETDASAIGHGKADCLSKNIIETN
jgi:hypothetical protein